MKRIVLLFILGIMPLIGLQSAHATATIPCDLREAATRLATIQESEQDTTHELDIRKSVLSSALTCAESEAQLLEKKLARLNLAESDMANLKSQLSITMSQAITYYEDKKTTVNDLGIRGTRELARDIALWRTQNYTPQSEAITNFIVWNNNQELFKKAANRFAQVRNTVISLKAIDNNDIQNIFHDAENDLTHAQKLNGVARDAIMRYPIVTDTSTPLKASLEALAGVYQTFFDLSNAIAKILPH